MNRASVEKPYVIEQPGSPEYFADGAVVQEADETVQVIFYVRRPLGGQMEHREMLRIHMTRSGFLQALMAAAIQYMPKGSH